MNKRAVILFVLVGTGLLAGFTWLSNRSGLPAELVQNPAVERGDCELVPEKCGIEQAAVAVLEPASPVELTLAEQLRTAADFSETLFQLLKQDEAAVLAVLPELVTEDLFFETVDVLQTYFAEDPLPDVLSRIEVLRAREDLHQKTAVALLKSEVSEADGDVVISFLEREENRLISVLCAQEVAEQLVLQGGADALDRFKTIEQDDLRREMRVGGAREWMREEPMAALQYISERTEPDPCFDEALELFVAEYAVTSPQVALEWSQAITDSQTCLRSLIAAAEQYHLNFEDEYRNWLAVQNPALQARLVQEETKWVSLNSPEVPTLSDDDLFARDLEAAQAGDR